MKMLIICLFLLVPMNVFAGACGDYEYAELQDMDQQTLEQEFCKVHANGYLAMLSGSTKANQSCNDLLFKMIRVYAKNFDMTKEAAMEHLKTVCNYKNK